MATISGLPITPPPIEPKEPIVQPPKIKTDMLGDGDFTISEATALKDLHKETVKDTLEKGKTSEESKMESMKILTSLHTESEHNEKGQDIERRLENLKSSSMNDLYDRVVNLTRQYDESVTETGALSRKSVDIFDDLKQTGTILKEKESASRKEKQELGNQWSNLNKQINTLETKKTEIETKFSKSGMVKYNELKDKLVVLQDKGITIEQIKSLKSSDPLYQQNKKLIDDCKKLLDYCPGFRGKISLGELKNINDQLSGLKTEMEGVKLKYNELQAKLINVTSQRYKIEIKQDPREVKKEEIAGRFITSLQRGNVIPPEIMTKPFTDVQQYAQTKLTEKMNNIKKGLDDYCGTVLKELTDLQNSMFVSSKRLDATLISAKQTVGEIGDLLLHIDEFPQSLTPENIKLLRECGIEDLELIDMMSLKSIADAKNPKGKDNSACLTSCIKDNLNNFSQILVKAGFKDALSGLGSGETSEILGFNVNLDKLSHIMEQGSESVTQYKQLTDSITQMSKLKDRTITALRNLVTARCEETLQKMLQAQMGILTGGSIAFEGSTLNVIQSKVLGPLEAKRAVKNLVQQQSGLQTQIDTLNESLKNAEGKRTTLNNELQTLKTGRIKELETRVSELRESLTGNQNALTNDGTLNGLKSRKIELESRVDILTDAVKTLKSDIEVANDSISEFSEGTWRKKSITDLKQEKIELLAKKEDIQSRMASRDEKINAKTTLLEEYQPRVNQLSEQLRTDKTLTKPQRKQIESEISTLEGRIKDLRKGTVLHHDWQSDEGLGKRGIEDLQKEKQKLQEELDKVNARIDSRDYKIGDRTQNLSEAIQTLETKTQELQSKETELREKKNELITVTGEIKVRTKEVEITSKREILRIKPLLSTEEQGLKTAKEEMGTRGKEIEKEISRLDKEIGTKKQELSTLNVKLDGIKTKLAEAKLPVAKMLILAQYVRSGKSYEEFTQAIKASSTSGDPAKSILAKPFLEKPLKPSVDQRISVLRYDLNRMDISPARRQEIITEMETIANDESNYQQDASPMLDIDINTEPIKGFILNGLSRTEIKQALDETSVPFKIKIASYQLQKDIESRPELKQELDGIKTDDLTEQVFQDVNAGRSLEVNFDFSLGFKVKIPESATRAVTGVGVGVELSYKRDENDKIVLSKTDDNKYELVMTKGTKHTGGVGITCEIIEASLKYGKGTVNGARMIFNTEGDAKQFLSDVMKGEVTPETFDRPATISVARGKETDLAVAIKLKPPAIDMDVATAVGTFIPSLELAPSVSFTREKKDMVYESRFGTIVSSSTTKTFDASIEVGFSIKLGDDNLLKEIKDAVSEKAKALTQRLGDGIGTVVAGQVSKITSSETVRSTIQTGVSSLVQTGIEKGTEKVGEKIGEQVDKVKEKVGEKVSGVVDSGAKKIGIEKQLRDAKSLGGIVTSKPEDAEESTSITVSGIFDEEESGEKEPIWKSMTNTQTEYDRDGHIMNASIETGINIKISKIWGSMLEKALADIPDVTERNTKKQELIKFIVDNAKPGDMLVVKRELSEPAKTKITGLQQKVFTAPNPSAKKEFERLLTEELSKTSNYRPVSIALQGEIKETEKAWYNNSFFSKTATATMTNVKAELRLV